MPPQAEHLRRWLGPLAAATALAASLGWPIVGLADPSPSPSPAPSYSPQACNQSTELTIQFDPATCVSQAVQGAASWVADQAIQSVGSWITSAAANSSAQLLGTLRNEAGRPNLGASWFTSLYFGGRGGSGATSPGAVVIAAWLMVLVVTGSLLVGVIRGDLGGMLRLVAIRLPVAIFLTYLATWLVSVALAVTDVASSWVLSGGVQSLDGWTRHLQSGDIGHDFLTVVACLILIVATLLGYLELLARDAAIYIVTAFIPLIAVASLWAGAHNALKRGAETLVVLCLSKFVLVFVLVLGATALSASTDLRSFAPLLTGTLIFLIAALAPGAIFRLIPILETTAVGGLAGGASRFGLRAGRSGRSLAGTGLAGLTGAVTGLGDRFLDTGLDRSPRQPAGSTAAAFPGLRLAGDGGGPAEGGGGGGGEPSPGGGGPRSPNPSPDVRPPGGAAAGGEAASNPAVASATARSDSGTGGEGT
jgi:hypothetical protein